MKTQFSFTKSGFTMFEIIVSIAIIGLMVAVMATFTLRPQENITKAERLAAKIQSVIHSSNVSLMMGRMDVNGRATTGATINIYASGASPSGNTISWQLAPTLSGKLQSPFFNDNDRFYQIETIKGCVGGGNSNSGTTTSVQIQVDKNGTIFTGSVNPVVFGAANILEIQVRYIDMAKKVIFDRRTGRTEIRRAGEDLCK